MLGQAIFFDDFLYHGFILPYLAVEETVLQPNATHQARGIVGARHERTLLPVACMRLFGDDFASRFLKSLAQRSIVYGSSTKLLQRLQRDRVLTARSRI